MNLLSSWASFCSVLLAVNIDKVAIDKGGIDKVGIDEVEVDKLGIDKEKDTLASYMELLTEGSKKTLRIIQISLAEQALDRLELRQYYILGHVYCWIA